MLTYCPGCSSQYDRKSWIRYKGGDMVMCGQCGHPYDYPTLSRTRLKLETARIVTAAVYLTIIYGDFTRAELARHLSVSNSPRLRNLLSAMALQGVLKCEVKPHPQSGRPTYFYSRRPVLIPATVSRRQRAFASPGAVV